MYSRLESTSYRSKLEPAPETPLTHFEPSPQRKDEFSNETKACLFRPDLVHFDQRPRTNQENHGSMSKTYSVPDNLRRLRTDRVDANASLTPSEKKNVEKLEGRLRVRNLISCYPFFSTSITSYQSLGRPLQKEEIGRKGESLHEIPRVNSSTY